MVDISKSTLSQKKEIFELLTKLIVFSKLKDKKNYLKRLSKLNLLSLEELYLYLETVIKYAYFCIDEKSIDNIIMLFKNDINYLNKIEKLLYLKEGRKVSLSPEERDNILDLLDKAVQKFKVYKTSSGNYIKMSKTLLKKGRFYADRNGAGKVNISIYNGNKKDENIR